MGYLKKWKASMNHDVSTYGLEISSTIQLLMHTLNCCGKENVSISSILNPTVIALDLTNCRKGKSKSSFPAASMIPS
jgi:hypothetical protein